jgi:uncharacterized BrkB/YihY/UPF0761 family membrane protein
MIGSIIIVYICFVFYTWIILRIGGKITPKIGNRMPTTKSQSYDISLNLHPRLQMEVEQQAAIMER